jgi:imidazolonepropionase
LTGQGTSVIDGDVLFSGYHLITMNSGEGPFGLVRDGALVVRDGLIKWLGPADQIDAGQFRGEVIPGNGRFLSPGLIDCHTHLIWGGSRADEWEMRLEGVSYEEIARRGGGILSTVAATRAASDEELFGQALRRLEYLIRGGVTTVEIKSGYGLDVATETRLLRIATRLRENMPVNIQRTFLGAHAVPTEYRGRADAYVDLVCGEMLDSVGGLCDAVDVFCEGIGFSLAQTGRVLDAALNKGLAIKVHAEQLSLLGGAALAAEKHALSADHLEYLDEAGIRAMAAHGTVAVLLPGAFYFLRERQVPPIELLRKHNVPMAIATDANPGSSPVASLTLMMNMACTLFRLSPAESMAGVTRNAARALGMQDRTGMLKTGMQADLADWDIGSPAGIACGIGHNPCVAAWCKGVRVA